MYGKINKKVSNIDKKVSKSQISPNVPFHYICLKALIRYICLEIDR